MDGFHVNPILKRFKDDSRLVQSDKHLLKSPSRSVSLDLGYNSSEDSLNITINSNINSKKSDLLIESINSINDPSTPVKSLFKKTNKISSLPSINFLGRKTSKSLPNTPINKSSVDPILLQKVTKTYVF